MPGKENLNVSSDGAAVKDTTTRTIITASSSGTQKRLKHGGTKTCDKWPLPKRRRTIMDIRRAVVEMQARRERNMQEKEIEIQNTVLPILKSVSPEMFTILCKVAKKRVPYGNREHLQGNPSEPLLNPL